jgi:hypothetical protein
MRRLAIWLRAAAKDKAEAYIIKLMLANKTNTEDKAQAKTPGWNQ